MKKLLPTKSSVMGFLLALVIAGIVWFGYNFGLKFDALTIAWKYPSVVEKLEVKEILQATMSAQLLK